MVYTLAFEIGNTPIQNYDIVLYTITDVINALQYDQMDYSLSG